MRMRERIEDILYRMETALGVLFFTAMFSAVILQVFYRYVLNDPLVWPFELSIYCYVFIIYLGGAMAARKQTHIAFEMLAGIMPARAQAGLNALLHIFLILPVPACGTLILFGRSGLWRQTHLSSRILQGSRRLVIGGQF